MLWKQKVKLGVVDSSIGKPVLRRKWRGIQPQSDLQEDTTLLIANIIPLSMGDEFVSEFPQ